MSAARRSPFRFSWALLLLCFAAGCTPEPDAEPDRLPPSTTAADSVRSVEPVTTLSSRLGAHIDSLVNAGGSRSRVVFTSGNDWSVGYIRRQIEQKGVTALLDTFQIRCRDGKSRPLANVIATIDGSGDSLVVICAHLDASASRDRNWQKNWKTMPAPGAVDNATGIAALIEIIGLVKSSATPPRHSMMFIACNAEEKHPFYGGHHLGSRHVAQRLAREGRAVAAVISIDMTGYSPRGNEVGLFANGRGQKAARDIAALKDSLGLDLGLPKSFTPCRNSDNESFDRFGFPSLLLMENCMPWRGTARVPRNPGYHTSRDVVQLVNGEVLEGVTRLVAGFGRE